MCQRFHGIGDFGKLNLSLAFNQGDNTESAVGLLNVLDRRRKIRAPELRHELILGSITDVGPGAVEHSLTCDPRQGFPSAVSRKTRNSQSGADAVMANALYDARSCSHGSIMGSVLSLAWRILMRSRDVPTSPAKATAVVELRTWIFSA